MKEEHMYEDSFPQFPLWLAIIILLLCPAAWAAPQYATEQDGTRIVLTDEPCKLDVENLKYRATWTEKGKTFEGCWGARVDTGVILGYFSDKTVVAIPIQAFTKVSAI